MLPFELTKDTPYLALSGELWSVFCEYFNRNWPCYKGFLLYLPRHKSWLSGSCTHDIIKSSPPSAAYMRQWIGQHCFRLWPVAFLAPSHDLNQCWVVVNWTVTLRTKLQWYFNQNKKLFIHANASENGIYKMAVILSRGRWVEWSCMSILICKCTSRLCRHEYYSNYDYKLDINFYSIYFKS